MSATPPLTSPEVAHILGKSTRTVHRLVESGELPAHKLPGPNGAYLFDRREVEKLARRLVSEQRRAS